MKIKKIGHCCLFIQTDKLNILTDPGNFSVGQNEVKNIDIILITHEHADHIHTDSLKVIISNNPNAKIITNSGVAKILDQENIKYEILEEGIKEINGFTLEAIDSKHEEIFEQVGQVKNTAYFINSKLFYPGDSFCNPKKEVEILALPVAGPWCKIPDAIRYALSLKPKKAFPVHDGMLQVDRIGGAHKIPEKVLTENGIEFVVMHAGDEKDF
jgi:L-ascorbate metabolism protein UlaG (beta-lactamase superfamily)